MKASRARIVDDDDDDLGFVSQVPAATVAPSSADSIIAWMKQDQAVPRWLLVGAGVFVLLSMRK